MARTSAIRASSRLLSAAAQVEWRISSSSSSPGVRPRSVPVTKSQSPTGCSRTAPTSCSPRRYRADVRRIPALLVVTALMLSGCGGSSSSPRAICDHALDGKAAGASASTVGAIRKAEAGVLHHRPAATAWQDLQASHAAAWCYVPEPQAGASAYEVYGAADGSAVRFGVLSTQGPPPTGSPSPQRPTSP